MQELLYATSYEPRLLSAPFLVALGVLSIVGAYALLVRGLALTRWSMVGFAAGLAAYVLSQALAASIVSPAAATAAYRIGVAFVPFASSCAMVFQLTLIERYQANRRWVQLALGSSVVIAIATVATDQMVSGVRMTPAGMYFFVPGPLFGIGLLAMIGTPACDRARARLSRIRQPPEKSLTGRAGASAAKPSPCSRRSARRSAL